MLDVTQVRLVVNRGVTAATAGHAESCWIDMWGLRPYASRLIIGPAQVVRESIDEENGEAAMSPSSRLVSAVLAAACCAAAHAGQIHVSPHGTGGPGYDWASAYTTIQEGVDAAVVMGFDEWVSYRS